jgi:hypothetical protein
MLSERALRDLGTLVTIDHLLVGERFDDAARHLSMVDREQARSLLRNRQSQLEQRLRACLDVAYGIGTDPKDAVDAPLDPDEHLYSLDSTFAPRMPVGANLAEALQALLDQLYTHLYPAHPHFEHEIKTPALRKVLDAVRAALESSERRLLVPDRGTRQLLQAIANPLKLATMGQTHLASKHYWPTHFEKQAAQSDGPLTVAKLRAWTDEPNPTGLTREIQNLLILCFAEQTDRSFYRQGVPVRPSLERLDDDLELREEVLPTHEEWDRARHFAEALFGLTPPNVLNAGNVERLVEQIRQRSGQASAALGRLVQRIEAWLRALDIGPETADRVKTLRSGRALLAALDAAATTVEAIQALARAEIRTSEGAMSAALGRAGALDAFVQEFDWTVLDAMRRLSDHRQSVAASVLKRASEAISADEHVQPLEPTPKAERAKALALLADVMPPERPKPASPPIPPGQAIIAERLLTDLRGSAAIDAVEELRSRCSANPDAHLSLSWRLTRE